MSSRKCSRRRPRRGGNLGTGKCAAFARRLCPSMYHAGYLEADEHRRADNEDSNRAQGPPDKRKTILASIGWEMARAIAIMGCHGDLLKTVQYEVLPVP